MTTTEILFGTTLHPVSVTELSRIVGVSPRTIANWKQDPDRIPLGKLRIIVRARRLSEAEVKEVVHGR